MEQQIDDINEVRRCKHYDANNPNLGLLILAAAIDRVAQSINELEIRVVTRKPFGV